MSEPFDYDALAAAGDDARKRKREEAMFPPSELWRFVERIANTPENTLEGFLTEYLALRDEARRLLAERK